MLAHKNSYRRDSEAQGLKRKKSRAGVLFTTCLRLGLSAMMCIVLVACGSKPTDPRTLIPGDALVYLETADLGNTLRSITENPKFVRAAKSKPDLSALNGIKLAIGVLGFEATEQAVSDENAVIEVRPRIVAIAETNAWGWQARSFIVEQLGEFVNESYGGEIELEVSTRPDGEFYAWRSRDDRRAFALQQGSLVYFSNDESAIDRCQAVKRGEVPPMAGSSKIPDGDRLAFGYVSEDGVGQIGNWLGVRFAKGSGEDEDVQSFVAAILPQIVRNSVKEVTWIATKAETAIEDKISIKLDNESSVVFNRTLVPSTSNNVELSDYVPGSAASATEYTLQDPQIAWRSVVLTAGKKTDETSGRLIVEFSASLFEPYGIEDPEAFLSSVESPIVTARLTADTEDAVVVAAVRDMARVRGSLAKEVNLTSSPERHFGAEVWRSEDGEVAIAFVNNILISGDADSVLKCLEARQAREQGGGQTEITQHFAASNAVVVTVTNEAESLRKLVELMSQPAEGRGVDNVTSVTETRVNQNGIERRSISDFGLIGSLIQVAQE